MMNSFSIRVDHAASLLPGSGGTTYPRPGGSAGRLNLHLALIASDPVIEWSGLIVRGMRSSSFRPVPSSVMLSLRHTSPSLETLTRLGFLSSQSRIDNGLLGTANNGDANVSKYTRCSAVDSRPGLPFRGWRRPSSRAISNGREPRLLAAAGLEWLMSFSESMINSLTADPSSLRSKG